MSVDSLLVVLAAVVLGSVVKGATGTGLPTIAIPVMAGFLGPERAVVVMAIPTVVTNSWLLWHHRVSLSAVRDLPVLLATGVLGVLLGTWALTQLDPTLLSLALAGVIGAYLLLSLRRPDVGIGPAARRWLSPPVGFAGGTLQGATGIAGPMVATYAHALRLDPSSYVVTVTAQFQLFALVQVIALATLGRYDAGVLAESLLALVPISLAMPLGMRLAKRLNRRTFDRLVLVVLAVMAAKLVWDAVGG